MQKSAPEPKVTTKMEGNGITSTSSLAPAKHPLLIENVMTEVFSYFENDASNLCQFRLVCPSWNLAAAPVIKRSLQWKVGPNATDFIKVMTESKNDVLRNFRVINEADQPEKGNKNSRVVYESIAKFLSSFGQKIVELRLEGDCHLYQMYEWEKTPNVEFLDIHVDRQDPCSGKWHAAVIDKFHRLKSLIFRLPVTFHPAPPGAGGWALDVDFPTTLDSLTVYGYDGIFRHLHADNLSALTSLKILNNPGDGDEDDGPDVVANEHLEVIRNRCKGLKILSVWIRQEHSEATMMNVLRELSPKLVELQIVNVGRLPGGGWGSPPPDPDENQLNGIHFPRLKILRLHNWDLRIQNYDMPILDILDLHYSRFIQPCGLLPVFPRSVVQLNIIAEHDRFLRNILSQLTNLRRLHLGPQSKITDSGILGIDQQQLEVVQPGGSNKVHCQHQHPSIRDLKKLQHFTYEGHALSNKSIHEGFCHLKELTYIKLPPFHDIGPGYNSIERVDACALVDACSALVRLDVNGFPDDSGEPDSDDEYGGGGYNWRRLHEFAFAAFNPAPEPRPRPYLGCGLKDEEIAYIKKKNPFLEIVYREKYSISQREEAARRGQRPA